MATVQSILDQRLKKQSNTSKMMAMAKQSAEGHLNSFAGLFSVSELSLQEKECVTSILNRYAEENSDVQADLNPLLSISSEVKAINNQAALLHGERIKKAQDILLRYKDGAFTAWLVAIYGNRQTPYNFMQYFDFCQSMPNQLRSQIECMPRQAIYTLAARKGNVEAKRQVVENYKGETKAEMLSIIQQLFPIDINDKRRQQKGLLIVQNLSKQCEQIELAAEELSSKDKKDILNILQKMQHLVKSL